VPPRWWWFAGRALALLAQFARMDAKWTLMKLPHVPAGERPVALRAQSAAEREGAAAPAVLHKSGSLLPRFAPSHEFSFRQSVRAQ